MLMRQSIVNACCFLLVIASVSLPGCDEERDRPEPPPEPTPAKKAETASTRNAAGESAATPEDGVRLMEIKSAAFANGEQVPTRFTGDGQDISPAIVWTGIPDSARKLALICDDPDAPRPEPWVHWVIYNIPATATGLPEAVPTTESLSDPAGAVQGKNSWGKTGYGGPAPPRGHGVHHYHFKLYAMDRALDAAPGLDKTQLLDAMKGHILAEAEVVGTYQR
jgi:Raf kinase inhibitor-like YbhB/YbcL family protein